MKFIYIVKKITNIVIIAFVWNFLIVIAKLVFKGDIENPVTMMTRSFLQVGIFYQFWFLGSLIIVLLIAPILSQLLKNKKIYFLLLLMLILVCNTMDILNHIPLLDINKPVQSNVPQTFRLWTWFMYYMIGGFFSRINKVIFSRTVSFNLLVSLYTAIIIFLLTINKKFIGTPYAEYDYDNLFVIINTILIFISLRGIQINNKIIKKSIKTLSDSTMGIFIVHVPILLILSKLVNMKDSLINFISVLLIFAFSFIVTYFLNKIPIVKKMVKI